VAGRHYYEYYQRGRDCSTVNKRLWNMTLRPWPYPASPPASLVFPKTKAMVIALQTVRTWLEEKHLPSGRYFSHGHCVCRFYRYRPAIVSSGLATDMTTTAAHHETTTTTTTTTTTQPPAVATAAAADDDDVNVVVAPSWTAPTRYVGACMSGNPGEMVYTNPNGFAAHYPWFTKWGLPYRLRSLI
jgi:hypothetical protein